MVSAKFAASASLATYSKKRARRIASCSQTELATGAVQYIPSPREAAELADVADSYLRTYRRLTAEGRAQVELGLTSLSDLHNPRRGNGNQIANEEVECEIIKPNRRLSRARAKPTFKPGYRSLTKSKRRTASRWRQRESSMQ